MDPRDSVPYVACQYLPGPRALVVLDRFVKKFCVGEYAEDFSQVYASHNAEFNVDELSSTKRRKEEDDDASILNLDGQIEVTNLIPRSMATCKMPSCTLMATSSCDSIKKDDKKADKIAGQVAELWIHGPAGGGDIKGCVPLFSFGAGRILSGAEAACDTGSSWLPFDLSPQSWIVMDPKGLPGEAVGLAGSPIKACRASCHLVICLDSRQARREIIS